PTTRSSRSIPSRRTARSSTGSRSTPRTTSPRTPRKRTQQENKMEIKKNIPNNTITRKLADLDRETGNVYESVNIIARRANQIATELKTELNRKLADFSSPTDTMEETFEYRE